MKFRKYVSNYIRAIKLVWQRRIFIAWSTDWFIFALPFEAVNLLMGILSLYYYGLMFGEQNPPILREYGGSFIAYLLLGLAANTLLTYSLTTLVRKTQRLFLGRVNIAGSIMNYIDYLRLSGIPITAWLTVDLFAGYINHLCYFAVYIIAGAVFFGLSIPPNSDILGAVISLLLGIAASIGLSLIGAAILLFIRYPFGRDPLTWIVGLLSSVFSGVYFPPSLIPESLRWISYLLPQTYTLDIMRKCLLGGISLTSQFASFTILLVEAILLLIVGILMYLKGLDYILRKEILM